MPESAVTIHQIDYLRIVCLSSNLLPVDCASLIMFFNLQPISQDRARKIEVEFRSDLHNNYAFG